MLEQVLTLLHNWFCVSDEDGGIHLGTYTIENGRITLPFLLPRQYYRIVGSVFNDGLHQYGDDNKMIDETFTGAVWALAIPKAVIDLAEQITAWQEKFGEAAISPYQSESFGGYSYSKSAGGSGSVDSTCQGVFATQLNAYRKL